MAPHSSRRPWFSFVLLIATLALPARVSTEAGAPAIRSVRVTPTVAFEGTDLRVMVRIEPHRDARTLQLTVEAPSYYASTERQLDGDASARAHQFTWRSLPAGEYRITATLECADRDGITATRNMRVVGRPADQEESYVRGPKQP